MCAPEEYCKCRNRPQRGRFVSSTNPATLPPFRLRACLLFIFLFSPCTQALELASQPIAVRVGQSLVTCAGIAGTSCHLRRGVGTLVLMLSML